MRLASVLVVASPTALSARAATPFAAVIRPLRVPIVLGLGFLFPVSAFPQTGVNGMWQLGQGVLVLRADGKTVSGTVTPLSGRTVEIYEGETDGKTVSFKAKSPDGDRTVTFTGTVNGDDIAFTLYRPGSSR